MQAIISFLIISIGILKAANVKRCITHRLIGFISFCFVCSIQAAQAPKLAKYENFIHSFMFETTFKVFKNSGGDSLVAKLR